MSMVEERTAARQDVHFATWPMGCTVDDGMTVFRLFCPRAGQVTVELFDRYEQKSGQSYPMHKGDDGIWNLALEKPLFGKLYGYRIQPPQDNAENFLATDEVIADPYSRMVTTRNDYRQHPLTLIVEPEPFDWGGDEYQAPKDHRDIILYEAHMKDLTAHPSSKSSKPGTYRGLIDEDQEGGIRHLKKLGVNVVEFFPLHKYAYFEPPLNEATPEGYVNTWNPYERNYWGYMTSFYFVPETMFASDGTNEPGAVIGRQATAIREFKQVVKALHKAGIAVIMDVVYNHVSQYDLNPFKYIDKEYYFRLDEEGNYQTESGCGNDFKTEAPMARQLICDSIRYWMEEFHVDGFRFDLANLIDKDTVDQIRHTARSINPDAILIAEPWGGGYDPNGFSHHDYAALNDQIRNGVKGAHPVDDTGFIFGQWQHGTGRMALENFFRGTLENAENGRFKSSRHSVNYLASHDGYTLGDFIRIALNPHEVDQPQEDPRAAVKLDEESMRLAKLAALYLFTSQGIVMIHEGQEWARTKIIRPDGTNDPEAWQFDHNSYEKDNETNYLDFSEIALNRELYEYYRGLIEMRKAAPALRRARPGDVMFQYYEDALHITFYLHGTNTSDSFDYFISLNGNVSQEHYIDLPEGDWEVIADAERAGNTPLQIVSGSYDMPASSGVILRKLRD